ncbi:MAG TPA: GNAT family N-acetyltransferase [Bryobacteraceae bacterium]|jgi:ribosomal protein S18 acetylase RimI-like enzyme|nr:GNAT family N-acetyltransferase [Bryobacteraceae bacterium]
MAFRIRHGRAGDADFLAWVMFSASRAHLARGLWDLIIGADEAGCLDYLRRLAFAEPRSLYHYESFLVAEVDGTPAAALCGFQTQGAWEIVGDAMANVQRDLGWTDMDATASYQRIAPIWTACMPSDAGADFAVESVATLPEYRRRGLVRALLDTVLQDAVQRGCRLAQITTYLGNDAAQSAYEKSGFHVLDKKRCSELEKILGVPGFLRLTRALKID